MSTKVLFISVILSVSSLFYIATNSPCDLNIPEYSVYGDIVEDSLIIKEAKFWGINVGTNN